MTEPTFPPRLNASDDPATRSVIDALANDAMGPTRAAQALARFEASIAPAAAAPRARWRPVAKVFLASVVALAAVKTVTTVRRAPDAPAVVSSPMAPVASVASVASAPAFEPVIQREAVRVEDLPSVPEAAAPPAVPRAAAASAAPGSTFREELALVQAARTSLKDGDTNACLRALDRYDRQYHGVFVDEIVVLRIEALLARGEEARASTIAREFLATHPDSPYESRIRSLLSKVSRDL